MSTPNGKTGFLDDKSLLVTPRPISSSSLASIDLDDIPQRESLGLLTSIQSDDLYLNNNAMAQRLRYQKQLARGTLDRISMAGIPSPLLRPTERSGSFGSRVVNESTISESDLLRNTSTPRNSTTEYDPARMVEELRRLSFAAADSFEAFTKACNDTALKDQAVPDDYDSTAEFQGNALSRLEMDEASWARRNQIITEPLAISIAQDPVPQSDLSTMGAYFGAKSNDLSSFLQQPQSEESVMSLTKIQRLLSDTQATPTEILEALKVPESRLQTLPPVREARSRESTVLPSYGTVSETRSRDGTALSNYATVSEPDGKARSRDSTAVSNHAAGPEARSRASSVLSNYDAIIASVSEASSSASSTLSNYGTVTAPVGETNNSRTSSALSNYAPIVGRLPLETSKFELIWGCVKLGKSEARDFILRNKSPDRIKILCKVPCGATFKVSIDRAEFDSNGNLKLSLHPWESKTFNVVFAPQSKGAATGTVVFSPHPDHQQGGKVACQQFVPLFAYGGFGCLQLGGVVKDTAGKQMLSLGTLDTRPLKTGFTLSNPGGDLPIFAQLSFVPSHAHPFRVTFEPSMLVLQAGELDRTVTVKCQMTRDDYAYFTTIAGNSVSDLGKIAIKWGTEADRGRLRRLCDSSNSQYGDLVKPVEHEAIPGDLSRFRERPRSIKEICKAFKISEIVLTIEHDLNGSVLNADETILFETLCQKAEDVTVVERKVWTIEPSEIVLRPPHKCEDMILISNSGDKALYYEAKAQGVELSKAKGVVVKGEIGTIGVKCEGLQRGVFQVRVYTEGDCCEVSVKVVPMMAL